MGDHGVPSGSLQGAPAAALHFSTIVAPVILVYRIRVSYGTPAPNSNLEIPWSVPKRERLLALIEPRSIAQHHPQRIRRENIDAAIRQSHVTVRLKLAQDSAGRGSRHIGDQS